MQVHEIAIVCRAIALCGLTASKVIVLHSSTDGIHMTQVASLVGHTTAGATGTVDALERLGYVKRLHDSDDRRKVEVLLLPEGANCLRRVQDMIKQLTEAQPA